MGKLYAAFVQVDAEQPFVYRLSEESIKQEFPDGTIETENFLLVKNGHYTKIFGTSGTQLDTPFVYAPNIMVYYSLEEESVVRFLKENVMRWNLLLIFFPNAFGKVKLHFLESETRILRNNIKVKRRRKKLTLPRKNVST